MKKVLLVAVLAILTTAGCISNESIMRKSIKQQHGKAAFADPTFSNPHFSKQYAIYKEMKEQYDRSGKLPVNWSEFEKCKLSTKAAAGVIKPHLYSDSEKSTKARAQLANAYKNIKPKIKPKKESLAKQAQMAKITSSDNSTERKTKLLKAEVYALKGQCATEEVLAKSKTRQIHIILEKHDTKTTVIVYGKTHVSKNSILMGAATLHAGTGADVIRNYNPEYKKNNPWKGSSSLTTSSGKVGRSYNSNNLIYGYFFNNGNSISFSITGGSIRTTTSERLSGNRRKASFYQGSKRTSVARWKNSKRHGLQINNGILRKGNTCYVNGVKSYKTDCERF